MPEAPQGQRTVEISGELDAATVPKRLAQSSDWFTPGDETVVDLANIERADSAGVALLLEWVRDAHAHDAKLVFSNAPPQMRAIIDFCALNDVIPLRDAA